MDDVALPKLAAVLDPIDRASEIIFGVLMATSFTGSLSVATASGAEIRTMMFAALGCNLAWGITDAVMYIIGNVTERHRKIRLLQKIQSSNDVQASQRLTAAALPERLAVCATTDALEAMRKTLVTVQVPTSTLRRQDLVAALGVFTLVFLSTIPVVIPFIFFNETALALRASNLLAIATVFACGFVLGRHVGGTPWRYGLAMAVVGVVLIGIIIALGG